jgi:DNA-binding transcriptional MocR family regulator
LKNLDKTLNGERMNKIDVHNNHLYLKIADSIENLINKGVLKIGDKLTSVRVMCKEQGVSISTVLKAYYFLESKGLIEAKPQSGYIVRFSPKYLPAEPRKSKPEEQLDSSSAEDLITEVYKNLSDKEKVIFSVSVPSPELLPVAKLNKAMAEAIRTLPAGGTNYENIQGNARLRRQIAKWSIIWDGKLTDEDIVTTTGCMNALALSLMAVTERGDSIIVESPGYFGILQMAESLGLNVIELPTDALTGIDIDALSKTLKTTKVKAILLVSNFSNPLGCCIPDEHKRAIVKLVQFHGVPLIEDDLYGDMYFSKSRPKTCKTYDDSGLVLWCSSVSKTLAPGYRVGWVAPGKFLDKVRRLKMFHEVSSATLQQEAIASFLENGRYEHHLRKLRNTLHANSLQYMRTISECFPEGTRISRPQGGFLLWIEMQQSMNSYQLYKKAMEHNICIAPGRMFTLKNQFHNCMRLSYGMVWNEKVENALKTLGELAHELGR